MGVVAATVANSVPRKRGSRALKPSDFFNQRQTPSAPLTDRQRASLVKRRAARKAKTKAKEGIHG